MAYRLTLYRPLILGIIGGFILLAVVFLVIALDTSDRALAAFLLFWVAGVAWSAYWGLVRYAHEVGITDESRLRWCSVTRCHEVPTSAIRGISTPGRLFGAGLRRIDVDGELSPVLIVTTGFADVIAMIERSRPDLAVRTAWYDNLSRRFGKRTLTWRRL